MARNDSPRHWTSASPLHIRRMSTLFHFYGGKDIDDGEEKGRGIRSSRRPVAFVSPIGTA
ncbi:MAG: hypothetical protein WC763_06805 [Candidatus Paceibacterota bacterium]